MSTMVQEAIEVLRELPEDQQVTVARAILDYASYDLADQDTAEVNPRTAH